MKAIKRNFLLVIASGISLAFYLIGILLTVLTSTRLISFFAGKIALYMYLIGGGFFMVSFLLLFFKRLRNHTGIKIFAISLAVTISLLLLLQRMLSLTKIG